MQNRSFQEILAEHLAETSGDVSSAPVERQNCAPLGVPLFSSDFLSLDIDPIKISGSAVTRAYNSRVVRPIADAPAEGRAGVSSVAVPGDHVTEGGGDSLSTAASDRIAVSELSVAARLALQTLKIDGASVSLREIRRRFHSLARRLHPDVLNAGSSGAAKATQIDAYLLIQGAYDLLCAELAAASALVKKAA